MTAPNPTNGNATAGEKAIADVASLLKARCTLLWVVTREELRAERGLIEACGRARYPVKFWDCANGLQDASGQVLDAALADPRAVLRRIGSERERCAYVLRDLHRWAAEPMVQRAVRSLARALQSAPSNEARMLIVLSPSGEIPIELADQTVVVDWPMPDREEIGRILDDAVRSAALPDGSAPANGARDAAVDAAVGLSADGAANCYARSLVATRSIDPKVVSGEKKRVIARERVAEWYDPDPRGFSAVGGLDNVKEWCALRRLAFSAKARAYGLPTPKGLFLAGQPGCGKSAIAKGIASEWGVPLLRADPGGLRSKFVGDSEGNARRMFKVADSVAPCVLWFDEIEKALAGSTGPQGDGGVASDFLGTFLQWMNDHTTPVFVVATANDVTGLPPELLRKGRFDELFFVDLPNATERAAILDVTLRQYGRSLFDAPAIEEIVIATEGWSGAEIAATVPDALFASFADGERELTVGDVLRACAGVVPLSRTARESIEERRKWAQGRARMASRAEEVTVRSGRAIDLD